MTKSLIAGMLLIAACLTNVAQAQERITTNSTVSSSTSIKGFARDFYFCLLENYSLQQGGKYYQMYVTSPTKTTVRIEVGGTGKRAFPINALEVLLFDVALAWELTQSGIVEEKAIHVWSDDADLSVSLMSRNPATSDGMTIIPTTSWGKEYVVASFASYAYLQGYELPSEFAIVASQDSTVVTILPSTDLRQGISTAVAYPRNVAFTIVMDRGEAVQYQASAANGNMVDYDVTGTIITASKPIGVEAGVECANIPASSPYCDHICEMLLPVDRWGTTFYTAPYINRKGGDAVRVIAAENNTTITRTSSSGTRTYATGLNKFESYIKHDIDEASMWQSDKPFMLVQYINSTDYPEQGSNNGIGDPAMVVIPPVSLFEKEILFQTPKIKTAETQFRNYINLIVNKDALVSTKFDGKSIIGMFGALALPGTNYIIYRGSDIKPGAHTLTSDSAAAVYVYGYGSYDAYAWPMSMGSFVKSVTDVLAPEITVMREDCYEEDILVVDAGAPAIGQLNHRIDSISNSEIDQIYYSGLDQERLAYTFSILDSSQPAYAEIEVVDGAGNRRQISHRYTPDLPTMPEGEFVYILDPNTAGSFALPITSGSVTPLTNITTKMKTNTQFQVFSAPSAVAAGQTDSIRFYYNQPGIMTFRDTLVVTADCWRHEIPVRGSSSPVSDFFIADTLLEFQFVVLGNSRTRVTRVVNQGTESFTVDSVIVEPNPDFELTSIVPNPVVMGDTARLTFTFAPQSLGPKSVFATVYTSVGNGRIRMTGEGSPSASVGLGAETAELELYPNPARDILTLAADPALLGPKASIIIRDVQGVEALKLAVPDQNAGRLEIDVRTLASGTYLLELHTATGETFWRKFTISR